MDYINTSVKDLKQLKIHTDVRKDPLFQSLMNVCRNDKKNLDLLKQESTSFVSHSFFDCFGFLIPMFLMYVYFIVYVKYFNGTHPNWIITAITLLSCFFSVGISLLTNYLNTFSTVVNISAIIIAYYSYKYRGTPFFDTFLCAMTIQTAVRIIIYFPKTIEHKKMLKSKEALLLKKKNDQNEFEVLYQLTSKQLDSRIKHHSEELRKNGYNHDFSKQHFWWKNHELRQPLSETGDLFQDEHVGRYESHQTFDQYDFTGEVIGKKESHYTFVYSKEFYLQEIPDILKENVFNHIEEKDFDNFCNADLNSINKETCSIIAIGCNWTAFENSETETTMYVHPTREQIEEARRDINRREDASERLRNAYFKGVPMTTEELYYATGGKMVSIQDHLDSDNRRSYAMDKFISQNSYEDVSREKRQSKENKHGTIFMYIIDNNVFFNKGAPYLYTGRNRTYIGGKNWISDRKEEIEEALNYMINYDSDFAISLANKLWGGFENEYHAELASKVYHTIANHRNYNKYFS